MNTLRVFSRKVLLPVSAAEAFAWHKRRDCFKRLLPPWEKVSVIKAPASLADGEIAELRCHLGPFSFPWTLEHVAYLPGQQFCDRQIAGPFNYYKHSHIFKENTAGCELEDRIEYRLPVAPLSHLFAPLLVERRLARLFRFRHRITKQDLGRGAHDEVKSASLRFLIAGGTGMVGSALCAFLRCRGHTVQRLVRNLSGAEEGDIFWNGKDELLLPASAQFDCVVNLAGANIASRSWTEARKNELIESRVSFTQRLVTGLAKLSTPPSVFISASGAGYYGDTGETVADESTPKGKGFLADLCAAWEGQALRANEIFAARVVLLRIAPVLSLAGGMLQRLALPFSLGAGATLGSGEQQMCWIALDDLLEAILFCSENQKVSGAVNCAANESSTNSLFSSTLAKVLRRPLLFKAPSGLITGVFGQLGTEALLANSACAPKRLLNEGYRFIFDSLESALRAQLGI